PVSLGGGDRVRRSLRARRRQRRERRDEPGFGPPPDDARAHRRLSDRRLLAPSGEPDRAAADLSARSESAGYRGLHRHLDPSVDMKERAAPSILIVDDDDTLRSRLARAFEARGFDVRSAPSATEAIALAKNESPEMAVVDLRMPGGSGLELVRDLLAI